MNKYLSLVLVLLLLSLASCGPVDCVDPDNWGDRYTMTIDAKGYSSTLGDKGQRILTSEGDYQFSEWQPKYKLDGKDVVMVINNPGKYKRNTVKNTNCNMFDGTLDDDYIKYLNEATWDPLTLMKNVGPAKFADSLPSPKCCGQSSNPPADINKSDVPVSNIASRFYMGMGLYASIGKSPPDERKIGCSIDSPPGQCVFHIGKNACSDPASCNTGFFHLNCPAGGMRLKSGDKNWNDYYLYMKILDRYYDDNQGSYTVTFKQGVKSNSQGGISYAVGVVTSALCQVSGVTYKNIVGNKDKNIAGNTDSPTPNSRAYISYVRVLLILYIVFLGISFIIGTSEMNKKELLVSVFKIGIIMTLISDNSWEFFSKTLFNFFQNGVSELVSMMYGGSATSIVDGDTTMLGIKISGCEVNVAAFDQIDEAIIRLFSYETTAKIMSVIFSSPVGFIFVIALYIAIIVLLIAIANAVVLFLVSYMTISLLIILAPLFIPFMLFKATEDLFENWLKHMISNFIQPLVVLVFAFFMLQLIQNEMNYILGYRVCWKPLFTIPVIDADVYAWQPDYDDTKRCILTPNAIVNNGGFKTCSLVDGTTTTTTGTCDAYSCAQERYIGYPYLDPNNPRDIGRIMELQNGQTVSPMDLLLFMLMIFFISKFGKTVPEIAQQLAGGDGVLAKTAKQVGGAIGGGALKLAGKGAFAVADKAYYSGTGRELKADYKVARAAVGEVGSMIKDVALWAPRKIYGGINAAPLLPLKPIKSIASNLIKAPFYPAKKALGGIVKGATGIGKGVLNPSDTAQSIKEGIAQRLDAAANPTETIRGIGNSAMQAARQKLGDVGDAVKTAAKDAKKGVISTFTDPIEAARARIKPLKNLLSSEPTPTSGAVVSPATPAAPAPAPGATDAAASVDPAAAPTARPGAVPRGGDGEGGGGTGG